jgi:signal transduction histidine kinase/DNA-binding response OmpR family regulator/HPt (histidine-containing phosphotransfer) domain-containing protein
MKLLTNNQLESYVETRIAKLTKANEALEQTILEMKQARDIADDYGCTKIDFLAMMSHEIRTPMNGVLGMSQLLAKTQLNNLQKDYVDTINNSGYLLLNILNDILDFPQIKSNKLALDNHCFDFSEMMEETVSIFSQEAHRKGLELVCIPPSDLSVQVSGDGNRLRQVLINLVSNAVKFTEEGEVVVSAELGAVTNETVEITLRVTDTGAGVPEELMGRVFNAYSQAGSATTSKFDGKGLGLTISQELIKRMGGVISLESELDEGSIFSFSVTLPKGEQINTRAVATENLQNLKILVVDNNETNQSYLNRILSGWGVECHLCSSGNEALTCLGESAEQGVKFDLAIVDYTMPEMDGVALATCIRRHPSFYKLPLILMSTIYQENVEGCFDEVMIKPIRKKTLLNNIMDTMGKQNGAGGVPSIQAASDIKTGSTEKMLDGVTVLLVEDNFANQKVALTMLKHLGAEVVVASSGEEAIEKFPDCSANIVLMDCQMPGVDGYQATGRIRALEQESGQPETPIIALTANAMQEDRQLCLDAGMTDYLTKPIEYSLLGNTIINNLQSASNTPSMNKEKRAVDAQDNSAENSPLGEIGSGIDDETLTQLKNICDDVSLYEQIISIYLVESKNFMSDLDKAFQARDGSLVAKIAHSFKSSSRNVGANSLGQLLENLEHRAKENALEGMDEVFSAIGDEYQVVISALQV